MITVTYPGGMTITPTLALIDTASMSSTPRTVVHDILDGPPVHTLRPAAPLSGTLQLAFYTEQAATDAMLAHRTASLFTVTSTDNALLNFNYVVTGGDIRIALDPQTASGWVLSVPFQEVV
jgi:hypothetical protein